MAVTDVLVEHVLVVVCKMSSIKVRSMNEKEREWDTFHDRKLVLRRMQEFDPYSLPRLSFERHSAMERKMYFFIPVNLESKLRLVESL